MKPQTTRMILTFAGYLEDPMKDPYCKALERRWIDETGAPTREGMALAAALADQSGTRSSFRNVA